MILEKNIDEISYRIVSVRAGYVFFGEENGNPLQYPCLVMSLQGLCAWKSNYYNFSNMFENTTYSKHCTNTVTFACGINAFLLQQSNATWLFYFFNLCFIGTDLFLDFFFTVS